MSNVPDYIHQLISTIAKKLLITSIIIELEIYFNTYLKSIDLEHNAVTRNTHRYSNLTRMRISNTEIDNISIYDR